MDVALVILHADPSRGGAERYTVDLADALVRRGHRASILSGTFASGDGPFERVTLASRGLTRTGRYRAFLGSLADHLGRHPYDVVHAMLPVPRCHVYHPHAGLAADAVSHGHLKYEAGPRRHLARLANATNPRRRAFAAVERRLLTPPDRPVVLCLSDYVKAAIRRHYNLDDAHLIKLFNAVDLAKFDPDRQPTARESMRQQLGVAPDRVMMLMVAQDFARKGLRQAIEALAAARDQRVVLVVVGRGATEPYAALAKQLGVQGRVVFAGPVANPYPYYKAADLFVLPTRHDPCSLVVLEALAMGLPVLSTRFNGACEAMTPGTHGEVLADPDDVPALAAAVGAWADAGKRLAAREACLALRPSLSFEAHVRRLEAVYQGVATPHPAAT